MTLPSPSADTLDGLIEARRYLLDQIKLVFPGSGHAKALREIDKVVVAEIRRQRRKAQA